MGGTWQMTTQRVCPGAAKVTDISIGSNHGDEWERSPHSSLAWLEGFGSTGPRSGGPLPLWGQRARHLTARGGDRRWKEGLLSPEEQNPLSQDGRAGPGARGLIQPSGGSPQERAALQAGRKAVAAAVYDSSPCLTVHYCTFTCTTL